MRILFHTLAYLEQQTGGSVEYNRNLVRHWPDGEMTILIGSPEASNFDRRDGPARVVGKKCLWAGVEGLSRVQKALFLVRSALTVGRMAGRYDWLVSELFPVGLVCAVARRTLGTKFCLITHGDEFTEELTVKRPMRLAAYRWIYRSADLIVSSSENTKKLLANFGARQESVLVVTPGVGDEYLASSLIQEEEKKRLGLEGRTVLLTVARLQKRKGHAKVLGVLQSVARAVPDICYVMVGDDFGERESLKAQVSELGLEAHVRFVGKIAHDELPRYYAACDCFIMASYLDDFVREIEGFGIVYLEAGAFGKPVIGGLSGGVAEAIVDGVTGIIVDATNAAELEASILRVLVDQNRARQLGDAGRDRVKTSFRWRTRTELLRSVLDRCLRERAQTPSSFES